MKKLVSTLFAIALIALSFTSCSSYSPNSPEGVVEKFLDANKEKDSAKMVEYFGLDSRTSRPLENMFERMFEQVSLIDYEIIDAKMADDEKSATVTVEKTTEENGKKSTSTEDINVYLNEEGNWCVSFM